MANLSKTSSGLLYEEDFLGNMSLIWDVTPNDYSRVAINSDSISILPGMERVEVLIPAPQEYDYVFQTTMAYSPTTEFEKAGCILKSTTDKYAELEIKGDNTVTCTDVKLKIDSKYVLNAKACEKSTGKWIDCGNTRITDANYIGYYMGANTTTDEFKIHNVRMYKSNYIVIDNFDKTQTLKVFNSAGVEITSDFYIIKKSTQVILDGTFTLFPIESLTIKIYNSSGTEINSAVLTNIYGGDVYEYSQNITFTINNVEIGDDTYHLDGAGTVVYYSLKVTNNEEYELENKNLKIEAYDAYNPGHYSVYIASVKAEEVIDKYEKTKTGLNFGIAETKAFSLRIVRNIDALVTGDDYKFRILFE